MKMLDVIFSKTSNNFYLMFSNFIVIRAWNHKTLGKAAKKEDPDQTAFCHQKLKTSK